MLYQEALIWKRLKHPNIVQFIGITSKPLQIISEWMPGGNMTVYINSNPRAGRITLVSSLFSPPLKMRSYLRNSWSMSQGGLITFINVTWFTEILKG